MTERLGSIVPNNLQRFYAELGITGNAKEDLELLKQLPIYAEESRLGKREWGWNLGLPDRRSAQLMPLGYALGLPYGILLYFSGTKRVDIYANDSLRGKRKVKEAIWHIR